MLQTLTRRSRRRNYIENYAFPPALRVKLADKLEDDRAADMALEGLRAWYLACLEADGELLGMPSRAVDVAWHEMILMTREYHAFCEKAFGRYLHHSPEALMPEPMENGLARTLAVAPLLFAVDAELGLADGYVWESGDLDRLRTYTPVANSSHVPLWASVGGGGCAGSGDGGGGGGGGCGGGG
jgi:hypothetical protein